ncbi:hypothetical protein [Bacteroides sp.]
MKNIQYYGWLFSTLLLGACNPQIPENAVSQQTPISISPDYNGLVIPCNIAPLNFKINEQAEEYITRIYSSQGKEITLSGQKVDINEKKWKELLNKTKGDTLYIDIYLKKADKEWIKYPSLKNLVAEEIDPYISYRLIEPSYVGYEVMTINQRDITNFKEKVIYNNYALSDGDNGQCINCHSYQNYNRTGNMQMHVRQHLGGTVIVTGDKIKKVNLKTPETISAGVYPSWHPQAMLIAYSTNDTGQSFHTKDHEKIEVQDAASDLILYDVEKNEVQIIANAKDEFESFPYWSADGKYLYYVSAHVEEMSKEDMNVYLKEHYKDIKYNLYRKPFDVATRKFGATDTLFAASEYGKSATFPRESPDGKYLLFTLGDYGTFHIWHKSSDLYLMELSTRNVRPLTEVNSPDVDSYHSWSSNGRWILFSTRRDDGSYTRLYIAYFDKEGKAHKPFILPQEDPDYNSQLFKSYNIPEFMVKPVEKTHYELLKAIEKDATNANAI